MFMQRRLGVAVLAAFISLLISVQAFADAVIDFGTGGAGTGGTVTLLAGNNVSGSGIPIGSVTITGAPTGNGTFAVQGTATGSNTANVGSLSFNTSTGTISIVGGISGLSIPTGTTLLSGTISSFDASNISQGLVSASGVDTKSPLLLTALGLPTNTSFTFFGFSLATGTLTTTNPTSSAISTDMKNTSGKIPEPASMLLFGFGLVGLGVWGRKRLSK